MDIQEIEHYEHEMGAFRNELEAGFALSQLSRDSGDREKIEALVLAGAYVVVAHVADYCRHTDALLGTRPCMVSFWLSREEATDAANAVQSGEDDVYISVVPRLG